MLVVPSVFSTRFFYSPFKILSRQAWLILAALFYLCCAQFASAQTFNVPATSTTGVYTITWSGATSNAMIDELQSGNWVTVGGGGQSGSAAITKTTSGTYTYRMQNCTAGPSGLSCSSLPANKSIVVSLGSGSSSSSAPGCFLGTGNTTSYCYDELGRVKSVRHPNGVINTYSYDAADNRTQKQSTQN